MEDLLYWRTARAALHGGAVEAASMGPEGVAVRNSAKPEGPVLTFSWDAWATFIMGAIRGDFDKSALTLAGPTRTPATEEELSWHG